MGHTVAVSGLDVRSWGHTGIDEREVSKEGPTGLDNHWLQRCLCGEWVRFGREREGGKVEVPDDSHSQCLYLLGLKNDMYRDVKSGNRGW